MRRAARPEDFVALRDLEKAASQAALGHVFPSERFPYPDDRVLARWRLVLDDPDVRVLVDEQEGRLRGVSAHDDVWLRHLAVRPDLWGTGLAADLVDASLQVMAERGTGTARLWVLVENHRARRFYERTGWRAGGDERTAEFVPHPREVDYLCDLRGRLPPPG